MADYENYSPDASQNNAQPPNGFPENMNPGDLNNSSRETMAADRRQHERAEWINFGDTVTRTSPTSFNVVGIDATARYTPDRRLRFEDASLLYGDVVTSTYVAPDTQVTVNMDAGQLTIDLTKVSYGINNPSNSSLRSSAFTNPSQGISKTGPALHLDFSTLNNVADLDTQVAKLAVRVNGTHQEVAWDQLSDGIAGSAQDLKIDPTSSPNTQLRVAATHVVLRSQNGGTLVARNVNAIGNINVVGAGGRAETTLVLDTWHYVYVISNRTTAAVLLSTSPTYGYIPPAGYEYSALVSAVYVANNGGADFAQYVQRGRHAYYLTQLRVLTGESITPNVWNAVDLANFVPVTANLVDISMSSNTSPVLGISPQSSGRAGRYFTGAPGGVQSTFGDAIFPGHAHRVTTQLLLPDPGSCWVFSTASSFSMHVMGFQFFN